MKVVTREYEVYNFEKLDTKAKEKVKNWYLDDEIRAEELTEMYKEDLRLAFPNSDLKVQWSLSNCQGDGVNIYGELHLDDILKLPESNFFDFLNEYKGYFTEKEKRTIEFYTKYIENNNGIMLPQNNWYSYCIVNRINFVDDIVYLLEDEYIKNINVDIIKKWKKDIVDIITDICRKWENIGYDYLYNIEDDDLKEICDSNKWHFLKDGTFFAE